MDLKKLFNPENPKCEGCSILKKPLPCHAVMDYESKDPVDILFISDFQKIYQGDYVAFRPGEYKLIMSELQNAGITNQTIGFTASMKCPNLVTSEIKAKDKNICKSHLIDTLETYNPKIVFACGKLATDMIFGKATDMVKKRGVGTEVELNGNTYTVVSIFHPWQVIAEPKNAYLFSLDIQEAISDYILGRKKKNKFSFLQVHSIKDLEDHTSDLVNTENAISIDIETTGLNFLQDYIHTVAISVLDKDLVTILKTIAIPLDHKDITNYGNAYKVAVCNRLQEILSNPKNRKIFQKAKFDLKFLRRYGIVEPKNVWDTKIMQHLFQEDYPKNLQSLVLYYFPGEI